jgi:hypothetical protein
MVIPRWRSCSDILWYKRLWIHAFIHIYVGTAPFSHLDSVLKSDSIPKHFQCLGSFQRNKHPLLFCHCLLSGYPRRFCNVPFTFLIHAVYNMPSRYVSIHGEYWKWRARLENSALNNYCYALLVQKEGENIWSCFCVDPSLWVFSGAKQCYQIHKLGWKCWKPCWSSYYE